MLLRNEELGVDPLRARCFSVASRCSLRPYDRSDAVFSTQDKAFDEAPGIAESAATNQLLPSKTLGCFRKTNQGAALYLLIHFRACHRTLTG